MHLRQSYSKIAQFALFLLQAKFLFWLCNYKTPYFWGFFNLKYFISCSWILSNSLIKDRNNGSVLELPVELPSTWTMHWDLTFLNLLSPLPSVNEKKESSFEGDPEIGPFSRESYYTSTQTSFLLTFSFFFLAKCNIFCNTPFFPSPKSCEHEMLPMQMSSVLSTVPSGEADA